LTQQDFKKIFDQHFDAIRSYIYYRSGNSELATDIAQDTFMRLWEKQMKLENHKVLGLLYKIAGNLFVDRYRREKLELDYKNRFEFRFKENTPEDQLQYKELKERYEVALVKMPEKQRTVFLMSRKDELKYHEIAERLELSVKAVEKRMKHALAFLKDELLVSK